MAVGRKTGGRQRGTPNKSTLERQQATQQASQTIAELLGIEVDDAHQLLTAVYRNPDLPIGLRIDAAKAALPYERPRLATVQHKGDDENPFRVIHEVRVVGVEPIEKG